MKIISFFSLSALHKLLFTISLWGTSRTYAHPPCASSRKFRSPLRGAQPYIFRFPKVKVFARLFQKAAGLVRGGAPYDLSASFTALFFLPSFFFCAYTAKRKSGVELVLRHGGFLFSVGAFCERPRTTVAPTVAWWKQKTNSIFIFYLLQKLFHFALVCCIIKT